MVNTLPRRRASEDQPVNFAYGKSQRDSSARVSAARVALLSEPSQPVAFGYGVSEEARPVRSTPNRAPGRDSNVRPHLVPIESPKRKTRQAPLLVRVNRTLQASLIALCGLAILGYGFDVAASHDVGKLQDQVRRLSEANSEQSSNLLKQVSYEGIKSAAGGSGLNLRVPEDVKIVKEVQAPKINPFKPAKHHLPLMSGY